jgi:hypothetical protein
LKPLKEERANLDVLKDSDIILISTIYLHSNGGKSAILFDEFLEKIISSPSEITFLDLKFPDVYKLIVSTKKQYTESEPSIATLKDEIISKLKELQSKNFLRIINITSNKKLITIGPSTFRLTSELIRLDKLRKLG